MSRFDTPGFVSGSNRTSLPESVTAERDGAVADLAATAGETEALRSRVAELEESQARLETELAAAKDERLTLIGESARLLEQVLDRWGWGGLITVEATDTVSARGKAKDADLILTSGEIARALGDVGVPLVVIENFTSQREIDAALRASYDI